MQRCNARPYEGDKPYIFISYCHKDRARLYPIIEQMNRDGYRVWYDEGIDPGSEWPEIIASHLNGSAVCLAFISEKALESHNCRREINFALLKKKPFISIVLEDVTLSLGVEMQLSATQSIYKYKLDGEEEFFKKLYSAEMLNCCLGEENPAIVVTTEAQRSGLEESGGIRRDTFSDQWFSGASEEESAPEKNPVQDEALLRELEEHRRREELLRREVEKLRRKEQEQKDAARQLADQKEQERRVDAAKAVMEALRQQNATLAGWEQQAQTAQWLDHLQGEAEQSLEQYRQKAISRQEMEKALQKIDGDIQSIQQQMVAETSRRQQQEADFLQKKEVQLQSIKNTMEALRQQNAALVGWAYQAQTAQWLDRLQGEAEQSLEQYWQKTLSRQEMEKALQKIDGDIQSIQQQMVAETSRRQQQEADFLQKKEVQLQSIKNTIEDLRQQNAALAGWAYQVQTAQWLDRLQGEAEQSLEQYRQKTISRREMEKALQKIDGNIQSMQQQMEAETSRRQQAEFDRRQAETDRQLREERRRMEEELLWQQRQQEADFLKKEKMQQAAKNTIEALRQQNAALAGWAYQVQTAQWLDRLQGEADQSLEQYRQKTISQQEMEEALQKIGRDTDAIRRQVEAEAARRRRAGTERQRQEALRTPTPPKKKSRWWMWALAGVAVLAIVLGVYHWKIAAKGFDGLHVAVLMEKEWGRESKNALGRIPFAALEQTTTGQGEAIKITYVQPDQPATTDAGGSPVAGFTLRNIREDIPKDVDLICFPQQTWGARLSEEVREELEKKDIPFLTTNAYPDPKNRGIKYRKNEFNLRIDPNRDEIYRSIAEVAAKHNGGRILTISMMQKTRALALMKGVKGVETIYNLELHSHDSNTGKVYTNTAEAIQGALQRVQGKYDAVVIGPDPGFTGVGDKLKCTEKDIVLGLSAAGWDLPVYVARADQYLDIYTSYMGSVMPYYTDQCEIAPSVAQNFAAQYTQPYNGRTAAEYLQELPEREVTHFVNSMEMCKVIEALTAEHSGSELMTVLSNPQTELVGVINKYSMPYEDVTCQTYLVVPRIFIGNKQF